jgi:hypothetical protein
MLYLETTYVYPSICDLVSVAKPFDGFSWNSVEEFFLKKSCHARFVHIGSVTAVLCSKASINFHLHFSYYWPIWVKWGTGLAQWIESLSTLLVELIISSIWINRMTTRSSWTFRTCTTTNDLILYSFPHYTFLWPEDGPQWSKHVVSLINRIQRQLCFDVHVSS